MWMRLEVEDEMLMSASSRRALILRAYLNILGYLSKRKHLSMSGSQNGAVVLVAGNAAASAKPTMMSKGTVEIRSSAHSVLQ